jgi:hypothetical protein
MATLVSIDNRLAAQVGDINDQAWDQTQRVAALNDAVEEITQKILGFAIFDPRVVDLLAEFQETESISSFTSPDFDLADPAMDRHYLANGFVNLELTIGSTVKYAKRTYASTLGRRENYYDQATDNQPEVYIWKNELKILLSAGSLPASGKLRYIGKPYEMVTGTPSTTSGKDTQVNLTELNSSLHPAMLKIAQRNLYMQRNSTEDIQRIAMIDKEIEMLIGSAVKAAVGTPGDEPSSTGNFVREGTENASKQIVRATQ